MFRRLIEPLVASQPMVFEVPCAPAEAMFLLRRAVKSAWLPYLTRQGLVGTVKLQRVCVWRHRPFDRNSFVPVFYGVFEVQGDHAKLSGHFRMHRAAKALVAIWFLGVTVLYVAAVYTIVTGSDTIAGKLFAFMLPSFFLIVLVAVFHLGWWAARKDVEFVASQIRAAIQAR